MEIKTFTRLTMLLALSVVLSLIESIIPFFSGFIPGLKLGLANIIIILVLYLYGFKEAVFLSVLRVFLVAIIRTGLFSMAFFFSLVGCLFSIVTMIIAKKFLKLSVIGVSFVGSIFHSIGQILVAVVVLNNSNMFYYLPWLILFSIPTGIAIGYFSKNMIDYFEKHLNY